MPLDKDRLGNAIADRILTFAGIPPNGTDETQLRNLWKAIADEIVKEIMNNATITMANGEFKVLPGTFQDNNPAPPVAIIGEGDNKAFSLTGKIS